MTEQADPPPISEELTALQIDELVAQYRREMARYEKTAALVGEKLRRELRSAGIKHMVSHRPKHPDDLAKKLKKKAKEKPEVYSWENLRRNLNDVVTDLAGCRVIVYWSSDEQEVVRRVQATFALPEREDAAPSVRRGVDKAYWATHVLVHPYGRSDERDDLTVDDAICELQIVTVAAHLYNEIEHDITYKVKMRGGPADAAEKQILDELRGVARVADRLVDELMKHRRDRDDDATRVIVDEEELRYAFWKVAERGVAGDFARLLSVLEQVLDRVTVETIRELGSIDALIDGGRARLGNAAEDFDDVSLYLVGLRSNFGDEIDAVVERWRGPRTAIRRALDLARGHGRAQDGAES